MGELVVLVFRDQFRAPEVLNELRRRDWPWISDLDEAVAVTLSKNGKARVHLSVDLSKSEAVDWVKMWGALLSRTLFIPVTDAMVEAADSVARLAGTPAESAVKYRPEANRYCERLQLSGTFISDVAALIAPGGSAVFMLLRSARVPTALEQLRDYGDTIVHTTMNIDRDDQLLAMLAS